MAVHKSIIYYTDLGIGEPMMSLSRATIKAAGLPIVSCSLNEPIEFGENYVYEGKRGWPTMARQIIVALENSTAEYVFFCEHDVLYHPSHFDFTPPRDDIFYYNANNWRWIHGRDTAISYNRMIPLSGLCCNRELALNHFKERISVALERGYDLDASREPEWARRWGYEPGTKLPRRGGFNDQGFDVWYSEFPNIDIRHNRTLSNPKASLEDFIHKPEGWKEISIDDIPGWNIRELFNVK